MTDNEKAAVKELLDKKDEELKAARKAIFVLQDRCHRRWCQLTAYKMAEQRPQENNLFNVEYESRCYVPKEIK